MNGPTVGVGGAHPNYFHQVDFLLTKQRACVTILGPTTNFLLFSTISFSRSRSLVPHLFPYAPLGPPPNHLTSHLMDHLTIPQSDITCHHSTVRSIPQHYHLTHYGLPAHCHVMINRQLMMELYLELPAHDEPYYT